MEPEGSLPHSQVPATCPYPEPAQSSPYPTSHFLKIHLNIILPSTPWSPKWFLSLGFPHQILVHATPLPHTRYVPRPSHCSRFYHPNNIGWGVYYHNKSCLFHFIHIVSRPRTGRPMNRDSMLGRCSRWFSSPESPHTFSCSVGFRGSLTGIKRPGREVDCLPASSTKVTNEWSRAFTRWRAFVACTGTDLPSTFSVCLWPGYARL